MDRKDLEWGVGGARVPIEGCGKRSLAMDRHGVGGGSPRRLGKAR